VTARQIRAEPSEVTPNQPVKIVAIMANSGAQQSSYTAKLLVNGEAAGTKTVVMAANTSTAITFTVSESKPGTYLASVADGKARFVVKSNSPGMLVNVAIIAGIAVLGLGLIVLIIRLWRRRSYY
jgi:hypothetical protein